MDVVDVMRQVRDCFPVGCLEGEFTLSGGAISPADLLLPGDWVAIQGSKYADGVYRLDEAARLTGCRDEVFTGRLWLLRPPAAFLALCEEIIAYEAEHGRDDLTAERFGAYSWQRAVDVNGVPMDWRTVFRARLLPWHRMYWREGVTC